MAITITRREDRADSRGECSYIRIAGDLRDDLKLVAAWSGRTQQDVGEDLLRQALNEVLPKIPKNVIIPERNKPQRKS